jgi:hypothetical protein
MVAACATVFLANVVGKVEVMAAERFSNASLIGNYAVANIGSGGRTPQAGVSVTTYDGKGSFSGVTIQDLPGRTFRERVFVKASFKSTLHRP